MGEASEIVLTSKQDIDIRPTTWRAVTIIQEAVELSWATNITKKRVEFPREDGKIVWGFEIEIPLIFEGAVKDAYSNLASQLAQEKNISLSQGEIRHGLKENEGKTWFRDIDDIALPKNIKKIKILDLSPQEALPKKQRNIDSKRNFWHDEYPTNTLTRQPISLVDRALINLGMQSRSIQAKSEILQDIFYDVFVNNKAVLAHFREKLEKSKAEEILIIHAHGGYDDFIGEQGYEVKGKTAQYQAEGNRISLTEVLDKYDQPEKYAAILVSTCYEGKDVSRRGKVVVYRTFGRSGGGRPNYNFIPTKNTTLISEPLN